MRRAQALLARMAQQVVSRLRAAWLRRSRDSLRDGGQRDALDSYAPPRQSNEPPYASLRQ